MWAAGVAPTIVAAAVLAELGCSSVLGVDADRYLAGSDAGDPSPGTADWSCLDLGRANVDPSERIAVTVQVIDVIQGSTTQHDLDGGSGLFTVDGLWLSGVDVQQCALLDNECTQTTTSAAVTDDAGLASFDLPGDFDGYFAMQRPDLVPAKLYPGRLVPGDKMANFTAYDLHPSELVDLVGDSPTPVLGADAGVGIVMVSIFDCQDHQAADVTVSYSNIGSSTEAFYYVGGLPVPSAHATDALGQAGAINVPAGPMTITAQRSSDKKAVGTAAIDVRPGDLSLALIRARTHPP